MEIKIVSTSQKGFTLLEILVAMGVAAFVGTLIAQVFFSTTRGNTKVELLKDVKQNGEFALGMMQRLIRNAQGISASCSADGVSNEQITLTNIDGNQVTVGCVVDGSVTRIASSSALGVEYLTSKNVTLGADCSGSNLFDIVCIGTSGESPRLDINFTLQKAGIRADQIDQASAKFETSVTGRN